MKRIVSLVLATISLVGCILLSGCGKSHTEQLQDARVRYFNGTASKSDKRMVEGFYKWWRENP